MQTPRVDVCALLEFCSITISREDVGDFLVSSIVIAESPALLERKDANGKCCTFTMKNLTLIVISLFQIKLLVIFVLVFTTRPLQRVRGEAFLKPGPTLDPSEISSPMGGSILRNIQYGIPYYENIWPFSVSVQTFFKVLPT